MKKEKIYLMLVIIFAILTFAGAIYVLYNKGQVNAGYAVIPMLFEIIFLGLFRHEKNRNEKK